MGWRAFFAALYTTCIASSADDASPQTAVASASTPNAGPVAPPPDAAAVLVRPSEHAEGGVVRAFRSIVARFFDKTGGILKRKCDSPGCVVEKERRDMLFRATDPVKGELLFCSKHCTQRAAPEFPNATIDKFGQKGREGEDPPKSMADILALGLRVFSRAVLRSDAVSCDSVLTQAWAQRDTLVRVNGGGVVDTDGNHYLLDDAHYALLSELHWAIQTPPGWPTPGSTHYDLQEEELRLFEQGDRLAIFYKEKGKRLVLKLMGPQCRIGRHGDIYPLYHTRVFKTAMARRFGCVFCSARADTPLRVVDEQGNLGPVVKWRPHAYHIDSIIAGRMDHDTKDMRDATSAKCQILCANCHYTKTQENNESAASRPARAPSSPARKRSRAPKRHSRPAPTTSDDSDYEND